MMESKTWLGSISYIVRIDSIVNLSRNMSAMRQPKRHEGSHAVESPNQVESKSYMRTSSVKRLVGKWLLQIHRIKIYLIDQIISDDLSTLAGMAGGSYATPQVNPQSVQ